MTATLERPAVAPEQPRRAAPGRRAIARWAWRLFRREWRQHALVLALVIVAVGATVFGLGAVTHAQPPAQTILTLPGSDRQLGADVAAISRRVGPVDVIEHRSVAIPGTVATVDLRSETTAGGAATSSRVVAGRLPAAADEVALTRGTAAVLTLRVGDTWNAAGRARRVVGLVENPNDLHEQFALVTPGQVASPETVSVVVAGRADPLPSLDLPSGVPVAVRSASGAQNAVAAVLALGTLGLLFVGLVAAAGFIVMAQRRERALGMLGAIGATDRQVRMVMLANGAAVGAVGAAAGGVLGLVAWLAFAPHLEVSSGHRFDRLDLPWWAIGLALVLAVTSAVAAAWWPARVAARNSVMSALSGRRPRPRPARRFAVAGAVVLAAGLATMSFATRAGATDPSPLRVIGGTLGITVGMLLLAPLAIAGLAAAGGRAPISIRLALRDLARYQARSGAALAAVTLAIGVAATVAVSASAQASTGAPARPNLPADELLVSIGARGHEGAEAIPHQSPAQLRAARAAVDAIAGSLHAADVVALDAAVDPGQSDLVAPDGQAGMQPAMLLHVVFVSPDAGGRRGFSGKPVAVLYVATPEVLARYGIDPSSIRPATDVLTARSDLAGTRIVTAKTPDPLVARFQHVRLPLDRSEPSALLTPHALRRLGLTAAPSAWLLHLPRSLTAAQIGAARRAAAAAGLTIETASAPPSGSRLGHEATGAGIVLALAVLAMTVGLIRSETANDLRTLAATGASGATRRTVTAATAAGLAVLGGLLGTAGAYAALVAWHRRDLHPLTGVPFLDLTLLVAGLPLLAASAAWVLAGREPPAVARQPLE